MRKRKNVACDATQHVANKFSSFAGRASSSPCRTYQTELRLAFSFLFSPMVRVVMDENESFGTSIQRSQRVVREFSPFSRSFRERPENSSRLFITETCRDVQGQKSCSSHYFKLKRFGEAGGKLKSSRGSFRSLLLCMTLSAWPRQLPPDSPCSNQRVAYSTSWQS